MSGSSSDEMVADIVHIDPVLAAAAQSLRCRSSSLRSRCSNTSTCSSRFSVASSGKGSQLAYHRPKAAVRGSPVHCKIGKAVQKGVDESSERILPYVPKAWEIYILVAVPMAPFILMVVLLGPLLLEE